MPDNQPNKPGKKPVSKPGKSILGSQPSGGISWITVIILSFIIYYFFFYTLSGETREISYSKFISEANANNIRQVLFKGQELYGSFRDTVSIATDSKDSLRITEFKTVLPPVTDQALIPLLKNHNVEIQAEEKSQNWWTMILFIAGPWILILFLFAWFRRRTQQQGGFGGGLFQIGRSRAKRFRKSMSNITFEDVAGLQNSKKELMEIVDYLKDPERYRELGSTLPKGVLLMGPPGTGKTMLARATAGEADVPFFSISGSEFIEMFVGVGASRVRDMFETAKKEAPAIIFIDEIDSVGRARGTGLGGGHDEREQTLNQILSEMDGFDPRTSVVVIAATNRPDVLDAALIRPGRFDRQITMEMPHKQARQKILEIHSRQVPLAKDVDYENLANRTVGFSGADLKNLVNEAALLAGRKKQKEVRMADFDEARDKIILGNRREEKIDEKEKEIIAYHEAGHALVAFLSEYTDPIQKVTIIPRGRSLGVTEQIPDSDRHNLQSRYLHDRIAIMLGGRVAESLVFGDVSTGAADDLKQCTQLVRRMVTQWGMSDTIGPVWFGQGEEHMFLGREMTQVKEFSEFAAREIDEEILNIIKKAEQKARDLLTKNRSKLDKLAAALLEHETLESDEIARLIDQKGPE
jgi:cell division protease FtsH